MPCFMAGFVERSFLFAPTSVKQTEIKMNSHIYQNLRTCSYDPGEYCDPAVNFALVNGLTSVTVHMSF